MNYSFLSENTTKYSDIELFNTTSAPPIQPDNDTISVSSIILISVVSIFSGLFLCMSLMICYENVFSDCVDCKCGINKKKENKNIVVIELTEVVVAEPDDATEKCSICLEEIIKGDKLGSLPCGHKYFHKKCIDEWMGVSGNKSCPICRKSYIRPYNLI